MKVTSKFIMFTRNDDVDPDNYDISIEKIGFRHFLHAPSLKGRQDYIFFVDDDEKVKLLYCRSKRIQSGTILSMPELKELMVEECL